jgi:hypothetical protein
MKVRVRLLVIASAVLLLTVALAGTALARPDFGTSQWKPKKPGDGIQVGANAMLDKPYKGVDMQLKHEWPIVAPSTPMSAYSFSVIGVTNTGHFVRMGYIVPQSDGGGLARWFVQILDGAGNEKYWKLSRAGEANPPPASSCSSGDGTCDGYPFYVGSTRPDTWQFLFDGISKANVRVAGSGSSIVEVYFLGEVRHAGELMGPRTALTTFRVQASSGWVEPASAQAFYSNVDTNACPFGVELRPLENATRADGKTYRATAAGSGVACTTDDLWP